jgi:hypothetical protein
MRWMQTISRPTVLGAAALLAAGAGAAPLAGQLPNPAAAVLASGENHTAIARGFTAISWNPGGLAMPGSPGSSFAVMSTRALAGLGPVGLEDIRDFEGAFVPEQVRRAWLDRIVSAGGEQGSAGGEVSYLAAHVGRFGVQFATTAHVLGNVAPGAAELLLFGNAGRTGAAVDVSLAGSSLDVAVASTAGFSYAQPLIRQGSRTLSLGATVKYTVGHVMVTALDLGSDVTADPLGVQLNFPIAQVDTLFGLDRLNQGTGIGLDLGLAWQDGPLMAGLAVRNVFNSFEWDRQNAFFRPGRAVLTQDTNTTDFDHLPFSAAPEAIRQRVEDLEYAPIVAAGAGYEVRPELLVSAELRQRMGDAQPFEPRTHLGVGADYRPLRWLPLRAGAAVISDGYMVSGGLGLHLGVVHLNGAVSQRRTDLGTGTSAMFTFSSESNW